MVYELYIIPTKQLGSRILYSINILQGTNITYPLPVFFRHFWVHDVPAAKHP